MSTQNPRPEAMSLRKDAHSNDGHGGNLRNGNNVILWLKKVNY